EIDAEGKPRFQGFEGFGAGAGAAPRRGFGGGAGDAHFETFNFAPDGFTRSGRGRGAGGGAFGGFERRGGRARVEPEDFAGPGADVHAERSVTLPEAARGVTKRLRLPTGKD